MIAEVVDPVWTVVTNLIESSPIAVALIIVMVKFLAHIKDRDERYEKRDAERIEQFEKLSKSMADVVKDNSLALRETAVAMARIKQ